MRPLARALVLLIVLAVGAQAAAPAISAPAEDSALESQTLGEAFNLLMDHYVQPLDSAGLLGAGWSQLGREEATPPGEAPALSGERNADLGRMQAALATYIDQAGSTQNVVPVHAMIRGMVHYVDEGHTYFLDQQQFADYQSWSRGDNRYIGIGVSLNTRNTSRPRIGEVYDGTPAKAAGLEPGDLLIGINDQSTDGMAVDQITGLIRGPAGTSLQLRVQRGEDAGSILTFSLERSEIQLQFVSERLLDDEIGYVSLRGFPEPSVVQTLEQDINDLKNQGAHSLVLDLRGNSGGRIDVGTRLLGDFLPAGSSVYEEVDRGGRNQMHFAHGSSQYGSLPLVVLVDGGTASMGEIFAAAVQQHGAATLVGEMTAGSVAAAQLYGLPDGSGLQVTVFNILSGDGKPLNRVGVAPDDLVTAASDSGSLTDVALSRAVEILRESSTATGAGSRDS